jgi:DNA-binding response OmpR family regulator
MDDRKNGLAGPATVARRAGNVMSGAARKKRVLVVDDQPMVTRFIEVYLKARGFDVISTNSGREALELVSSSKPDIMLLDIVMPDMDGFEVMRRLRAFSRLPVIAISASTGNHKGAEVMGADDFMPKPFHSEDMLKRINRLLGM